MATQQQQEDEILCLQYFGNQVSAFQINVDNVIYNQLNPFNQKKTTIEVLNNNFLTNYETLAQLIIKKKNEIFFNKVSSSYLNIFKSNIKQFFNVGELLLKKYFNCNNYKEWQQNIEQLLNHHHKNSHTKNQPINATESIIISKLKSLKTITNIENIIKQLDCNYGILNDYISDNISEWKMKYGNNYFWFFDCFTEIIAAVLEYFLKNYENNKFIELSNTKPIPIDDDEEKKLLMKRIEEQQSTISNLQQQMQNNLQQTQFDRMENNQLKEQNSKLELQLSQSKQQVQNLTDVNQLKEQINKLENNQLKEQNNKLQLQLSQANTILSLNSFNLLQQKYIEQSKNILLKYFNNELMNILLNIPSITIGNISTYELLELLMKRSICYAFNTKYSINNTPPTPLLPSSSESSIISSAMQHLVILMTQNGLFNSGGENGGLTSIVGILLERFHKLVKELFDCIHSIPKEALIQFDFTNNIKDKTLIKKMIESTTTTSSSNSNNTTTTITIGSNNSNGGVGVVDNENNYYCIQPTLYSGVRGCSIVVEQQGILVDMFTVVTTITSANTGGQH